MATETKDNPADLTESAGWQITTQDVRDPPNKEPRCEVCRFWLRLSGRTAEIGRCRRNPPVIAGTFNLLNGEADCLDNGKIGFATRFPVTHEEEWCGDFEWDKKHEPFQGMC